MQKRGQDPLLETSVSFAGKPGQVPIDGNAKEPKAEDEKESSKLYKDHLRTVKDHINKYILEHLCQARDLINFVNCEIKM